MVPACGETGRQGQASGHGTNGGRRRYGAYKVETPSGRLAMRRLILALATAVALAATPALAAPTCQTQTGETARCGTPGAMPLGWRAPPDDGPAFASLDVNQAFGIVLMACIFALLALMPDFDGRSASDWDRQEDDGPN